MREINGMVYPDELLEWLQPGNVLRSYMNCLAPNELYHVRKIIDDDQVVTRRWLKHKRRWCYEVMWFYEFLWKYKSGNLEFVKKEKL